MSALTTSFPLKNHLITFRFGMKGILVLKEAHYGKRDTVEAKPYKLLGVERSVPVGVVLGGGTG
jgi:hypothetical protein